jgi:hypothetical protein
VERLRADGRPVRPHNADDLTHGPTPRLFADARRLVFHLAAEVRHRRESG